jgi:membrane protein DedA with SNARE-associated domain
MDIATLAGIALSTLVSEDLASIAAGLLAREHYLPVPHAVAACVVGIYVGDLGLWAAGRLLRFQAARLPRLSRILDVKGLSTWGPRIDERLGVAVLASRFVPGSRLPMYVALGLRGRRPFAFAAWSLVAVLVWTPLLVVSTASLGEAVAEHLLMIVRIGVAGSMLTAIEMLGALRLVSRAAARAARRYHQRFAHTIETPT